MPDPFLTIGLPLWRARPIVWLALESLARQRDAPPWELIVVEEARAEADPAGLHAPTYDLLASWENSLHAAGCVRVCYVPLPRWVPLSLKWLRAAREASAGSMGFILQAADCYSPPRRLRETFALLREGATWVRSPRGYFYDILTGDMGLYDQGLTDHPGGLNMAVRLDLVQRARPFEQARGVDGALFRATAAALGASHRTAENRSEDWTRGLDTHGLNTISRGRRSRMRLGRAPFRAVAMPLRRIMPPPIAARLEGLRPEAKRRLEILNPPAPEPVPLRRDAVPPARVYPEIH